MERESKSESECVKTLGNVGNSSDTTLMTNSTVTTTKVNKLTKTRKHSDFCPRGARGTSWITSRKVRPNAMFKG